MSKPKPVAILCADLHLSLTPPACRAETPEKWLDVQAHYLKQLRDLRESLGHVEVFCSGDIFDRWNPSPELINFALEHLPGAMLAVPGQHDLMHHRYDLINKSGYGVLKRANKIYDMTASPWSLGDGGTFVYGFGWNQPIALPRVGMLKVALIHRFVWVEGKGYPGAPKENNLPEMKGQLKGYDVAAFGDNHKGFLANTHPELNLNAPRGKSNFGPRCVVFNCGTFIRRKADEINYKPHVGILYSDGIVKPHYLDTSIDRFHDRPEEREQKEFDMRAFLESLEDLGEQGLNFHTAVENYLRDNKVTPSVKARILKMLQ